MSLRSIRESQLFSIRSASQSSSRNFSSFFEILRGYLKKMTHVSLVRLTRVPAAHTHRCSLASDTLYILTRLCVQNAGGTYLRRGGREEVRPLGVSDSKDFYESGLYARVLSLSLAHHGRYIAGTRLSRGSVISRGNYGDTINEVGSFRAN